jgi:hypothetical protein
VLRNQDGARASGNSCWQPAARVAAAGNSGTMWRGEEKPAGVGRAAGRRAGGPGGGVRAARCSWQRGISPVRGGGRCSRAAERKGREEDDGDLFEIF